MRRWIPMTLCLAAAMAAPSPAPAATSGPNAEALLNEARASRARGTLEDAADHFEAFGRAFPSAAEALGALEDAIALRLALGQPDKAGQDAQLLVARYGKADPARVSRASLSVADYEVEHHVGPSARARLVAWVAAFGETAPLDARLHAQALLGRAAIQLNNSAGAGAAYGRVLDLWKDPDAAQRTLATEGADARRISAVLMDVGEALFYAAEQKRKEADKIHFPEYRGPGNRDDVLLHVRTAVVEWVRKKRPALEAVEREYQKIVDLKPAPPPKWVVRSASRVGQAWGKFVAEFRAAPIPAEWKGHGPVPGTSITYNELRSMYYAALDEASEPQKQRAKAAFKTCLAISTKYAYADEFSNACHMWLTANYPNEFAP
jgi:tetratricopeptide (TPR) repeat protein